MLTTAIGGSGHDDVVIPSAAMAFYSMFSLSPLPMLLVTATSLLGEDTQQQVVERFEKTVNPQAGQTVGLACKDTLVVLFGAEPAYAYTQCYGHKVRPDEHVPRYQEQT